MKRILFIGLVALGCKKSQPQGLPPANDWGSAGSGSAMAAPRNDKPAEAQPLPPNHPPVAASNAKTLAKLPDGKLALGPYAIKLPDGWVEAPTTSDMRAAQFKIGTDAELVVYYFGDQGAGSTQANLDRWIAQFSKTDGKPKVEQLKVAGQDATIVSVTGHYTAMAMGAGEAVDKDDQMMLAAITASPKGPYYWKLVGSRATVTAHAAKFRALLTGAALTP